MTDYRHLPQDSQAAYQAATASLMTDLDAAWFAYLAHDHASALIEDRAFEEARAAKWRAEYSDYLCMMSDHGCICVALGYDDWARVTHPAVTS